MNSIDTIEALTRTLINSDTFHALIIESLPGWGKSTAVDVALSKCGVKAVAVGAYATPLHLYHMICRHPTSVLLLDDCAGLFSDQKSMAILKAATWKSAGNDHESSSPLSSPRKVSWGSTSEKVESTSTEFFGKLILLTNAVPRGKETEALLSRCLSYRITFNERDIERMLGDGARSKIYFPNTELAEKVAAFLIEGKNDFELMKVNFRTLKMGYALALTHGENWRELFYQLIPRRLNREEPTPSDLQIRDKVRSIVESNLSAKEQESRFISATGKSRRTFYLYKRRLGFTRPYQKQDGHPFSS